MSESRAQRQAALEERKRRIAELREQRVRRQEDTARVQASATANLDDYVTGLLNEPPPVALSSKTTSAAAAQAQQSQQQQPSPVDAATAAAPEATAATAAPTSTDNVVAQAVAPAPAPVKKIETFTVATQTIVTDFVEPPEATAPEEEERADEAKTDETATKTDDKDKETSGDEEKKQQPKVLSTDQVEKEVASMPFSTFISTASKKVERVLGTPLLSDLLVDTVGDDAAGAAAAGGATDGAGKSTLSTALADDSKFVAARQVYECPKWTAGRDVTDIDWSPLHRELVLSTHHVKQASSASVGSTGGAAISAISPHDTPSASLTPRSGELQSDGLALVWSLTMPHRPEHVFTCGSPVTAGRFHPTDSTLVVGGCESGQVVVWDIRAGRLPVQKSALTSLVMGGASSAAASAVAGHVHPISTMAVLEGGAGFVTSSTDGKVNFWSLSNLREPAESFQLPSDSVSCFAVAPESETLILGDENGALYAAAAAASASSAAAAAASASATAGGGGGGPSSRRRQVRKLQANAAVAAAVDGSSDNNDNGNAGGGQHYGLVTALSTKRLKKTATAARTAGLSPKGFLRGSGGLVLSAGVDWTVKLWAPAYRDAPLTSFVSHSYDYMSDVQWSPAHAALFATASSNGTIGLWNLAQSLDTPLTGTHGIVVEPYTGGAGGGIADGTSDAQLAATQQHQRGLNKLRWSMDGRRLAVAASDRLHMLTLTSEAIRSTDYDADAKTMMNAFMARGWISSRQ